MAIRANPLRPVGDDDRPDSKRPRIRRRRVEAAVEAPAPEAVAESTGEQREGRKPARPARTRTTSWKDAVRANPRPVAALILLAVGIVFVILGWYGAANTNILTEQIPYLISGGLLGVALIIVAGFLAASTTLERENRELRRDLNRALSAMANGRPAGGPGLSPAPVASEDGRVFVVPGGRSYHVAGCPILEGKQESELDVDAAIRSGFAACKLCGPD